jgi:hypothetical protein
LKHIFPADGSLQVYPVKKILWGQLEPSEDRSFIRVDNKYLHKNTFYKSFLQSKNLMRKYRQIHKRIKITAFSGDARQCLRKLKSKLKP